jgi:hypothetical protein
MQAPLLETAFDKGSKIHVHSNAQNKLNSFNLSGIRFIDQCLTELGSVRVTNAIISCFYKALWEASIRKTVCQVVTFTCDAWWPKRVGRIDRLLGWIFYSESNRFASISHHIGFLIKFIERFLVPFGPFTTGDSGSLRRGDQGMGKPCSDFAVGGRSSLKQRDEARWRRLAVRREGIRWTHLVRNYEKRIPPILQKRTGHIELVTLIRVWSRYLTK